jgi:hypothetical protein
MEESNYNIGGEWPDFDSLGELFDWLSDQRDLKAAQSSSHGNPEISKGSAGFQREVL